MKTWKQGRLCVQYDTFYTIFWLAEKMLKAMKLNGAFWRFLKLKKIENKTIWAYLHARCRISFLEKILYKECKGRLDPGDVVNFKWKRMENHGVAFICLHCLRSNFLTSLNFILVFIPCIYLFALRCESEMF